MRSRCFERDTLDEASPVNLKGSRAGKTNKRLFPLRAPSEAVLVGFSGQENGAQLPRHPALAFQAGLMLDLMPTSKVSYRRPLAEVVALLNARCSTPGTYPSNPVVEQFQSDGFKAQFQSAGEPESGPAS